MSWVDIDLRRKAPPAPEEVRLRVQVAPGETPRRASEDSALAAGRAGAAVDSTGALRTGERRRRLRLRLGARRHGDAVQAQGLKRM